MKKLNLFRSLLFASCVSLSVLSTPAQTPVPLIPIPKRLTLAEAENLLIQRNLSVIAAKYNIEAGRAAKLMASYKPNPILTIGAEQFHVGHPYHGIINTDTNAGAQPTFTLRVDKIWERGNKRELRTEVADYQIKTSEAQMLDAMRTQLYQLRQAFTSATLARENLLVAEATEQQYTQTEKLTEIKVEQGDVAGVEVYRVRAGRLQFQQAVLQAHTAYEQAARDVINLLGAKVEEISGGQIVSNDQMLRLEKVSYTPEQPQESESLRGAPIDLLYRFDDRPLPNTISELRAAALSERPDVIAARNTLLATGSSIKLAQAQRTRDVSIGYEFQRVGQDHALGVVVQIPLFTYNNQQAGIAQAEAQQMGAAALLKQAETQAVNDVEKAYQSYLAARRMLELYNTQNLNQVEKLRSIAAYSFKEGALSLFEVLDAQRTYNQTITAYNQARADYQNSLWQLEYAIGKPLR